MKLKKNTFIQGAFIATLGIVISKILGIIYVIPFYAIIGDQGGALYGYAYNIYSIFLGISQAGLPLAMSKLISEYNTLGYYQTKEKIFKVGKTFLTILGIICFLVLFVFAPLIADLIIGGVNDGNTPEDIVFVIRIISTAMLRSLMKAKYKAENEGHFGLAFEYYCHFTSPIRRYPDLTIHRIIKEFIKTGITEERNSKLLAFTQSVALNSSEKEVNAENAEREVEDIKKAEFMHNKIGEEFSGIISSVTSFGFFVELENSVEGLVRIAELDDDYYIYDEKNFALIGERKHKVYKIGDAVRIIVAGVDVASHQIDFVLK